MNPAEPRRSVFAFLAEHEPLLVKLPTLAEEFLYRDPNTSLLKLRQFGECLTRRLKAVYRLPQVARETQLDLIRRLQSLDIIDDEVAAAFNSIRTIGNTASHSFQGTLHDAISALESAHQLGVWFHRRFGQSKISSSSYKPPAPHTDDSELLRARLATLLADVEAARAEADRESRLRHDTGLERDVALELALEAEARLLQGATALASPPDYNRPMVWEEQRHHLEHFVGRTELVNELVSQVTEGSKSYTVIVGAPGTGKSALLSSVADTVARHGNGQIPVLLHLSRGGVGERRVLQFLLWQASRYLAEPVGAQTYQSSTLELRDAFISALATCAKRHGRVFVAIDALDELVEDIDQPARSLVLLPDILPAGVHILLSSRPLDTILTHLRARLPALSLRTLPSLQSAEISEFLRNHVDDSTFAWLERTGELGQVVRKTKGIPLLLHRTASTANHVARAAEDGRGIEGTWIPRSIEAVFADQLREAGSGKTRSGRGRSLRLEILGLLAVTSEPIGAEELRRALLYLSLATPLAAVKRAVAHIEPLLIGLGGQAYRLYHEGFAEYVRAEGGPDALARWHRALAGEALTGEQDVLARVAYHARHLVAAHNSALSARDDERANDALNTLLRSVLRLEHLSCALQSGALQELIEVLGSVAWRDELTHGTNEHQVLRWTRFLSENLAVLSARPQLLAQQLSLMSETLAPIEEVRATLEKHVHFRRIGGSKEIPAELATRSYPGAFVSDRRRRDGIHAARSAPVLLACAHDNEVLGMWRRETGERLWMRRLGSEPVCEVVCVSEDGRFVAVATSLYSYPEDPNKPGETLDDPTGVLGGLLLLDGTSGDTLWTLREQFGGAIAGMTFSSDARTLYVATGNDSGIIAKIDPIVVHAIDVSSGEISSTSSPEGRLGRINAIQLSSDQSTLVLAGRSSEQESLGALASYQVGDLGSGADLWPSQPNPVICLERLEGGRIVAASEDGHVGPVDLGRRIVLWSHTGFSELMRIRGLPNGNVLLMRRDGIWNDPSTVALWDLDRARRLGEALSLGRGVIAMEAGWSNEEWLLGTSGGVLLQRLSSAPQSLQGAGLSGDVVHAYSRDLRLEAVATGETTIVVRDVADGRQSYGLIRTMAPLASYGSRLSAGWSGPQSYVSVGNSGWIMVVNDLLRDVLLELDVFSADGSHIRRVFARGVAPLLATLSADGRIAALILRPGNDSFAKQPKRRTMLEEAIRRLEGLGVHLDDEGIRTPLAPGPSESAFNVQSLQVLFLSTDTLSVIAAVPLEDTWTKVELSGRGTYAAVWSRGRFRILKVATGSEVLELRYDSEVSTLGIVDLLLPADSEGEVPDEDELRRTFAPSSVAFSMDENTVLVSGTAAKWWACLRRWELRTGEEYPWSPLPQFERFSCSLDGRFVLAPAADGLCAYDIDNGVEVGFWPRHDVERIAVRDEGRIAIVTRDGWRDVIELCAPGPGMVRVDRDSGPSGRNVG